ncbi:envelope glycoprotein [Anopheles sinensis]|uniref:Envelope glycoprotein n=1 Tax=Anopheles sinensis TaxID=74873 RepID=A0A084VXG7_ANOSI|nr:envelope glycoprotein [Anopheles sinensis]
MEIARRSEAMAVDCVPPNDPNRAETLEPSVCWCATPPSLGNDACRRRMCSHPENTFPSLISHKHIRPASRNGAETFIKRS